MQFCNRTKLTNNGSYACINGAGIGADFDSSPIITGNIISNNGCGGSGGYGQGIRVVGPGSATIMENIIKESNCGIRSEDSATITVTGNTITGNDKGIYNVYGTSALISGNKITSNNYGIITDSSDTIAGNIISGNSNYGIYLHGVSMATITNNKIIANGIDDIINAGGTSFPNISFNLYDTIQGSGAVGMYNVKSDGTPALLP